MRIFSEIIASPGVMASLPNQVSGMFREKYRRGFSKRIYALPKNLEQGITVLARGKPKGL